MAWTKAKISIVASVSILLIAGTTAVIVASKAKKPLSTETMSSATASTWSAQRPGQYVSLNDLAYVGYATPEAALETAEWAMMKGTLEQWNDAQTPNLRPKSITQGARDSFEARQALVSPAVKGFQIIAKKTLADDHVSLKYKEDYDPAAVKRIMANSPPGNLPPVFRILGMVKIGDEWKVGTSSGVYTANWEKTGEIQTYTP